MFLISARVRCSKYAPILVYVMHPHRTLLLGHCSRVSDLSGRLHSQLPRQNLATEIVKATSTPASCKGHLHTSILQKRHPHQNLAKGNLHEKINLYSKCNCRPRRIITLLHSNTRPASIVLCPASILIFLILYSNKIFIVSGRGK